MQQSQRGAHQTRDQHAKPWRAGETRRCKSAHGPHQQGAFEADIDPTAFFGQHFAETDKKIRRRYPDRARHQGKHHAVPAKAAASLTISETMAGVQKRIAREHAKEDETLQDQRGGSRHVETSLQHARRSPKSAHENRDGNDCKRILARQKGDQNSRIAKADNERFARGPMYGQNFEGAGETGPCATDRDRQESSGVPSEDPRLGQRGGCRRERPSKNPA